MNRCVIVCIERTSGSKTQIWTRSSTPTRWEPVSYHCLVFISISYCSKLWYQSTFKLVYFLMYFKGETLDGSATYSFWVGPLQGRPRGEASKIFDMPTISMTFWVFKADSRSKMMSPISSAKVITIEREARSARLPSASSPLQLNSLPLMPTSMPSMSTIETPIVEESTTMESVMDSTMVSNRESRMPMGTSQETSGLVMRPSALGGPEARYAPGVSKQANYKKKSGSPQLIWVSRKYANNSQIPEIQCWFS